MAELQELAGRLKSISKQVKFAQAQTLTKVARLIQEAEVQNIKSVFDNPTPFTLKSVRSVGARRDNLQAKVFIQDIAASYLDPFENGGIHKLNSQALLNPKNLRLNQHGNLSRNKTKSLMGKDNVFVGAVGEVNGIWQRKKLRRSKKGARRKASTPKYGSQLKLLIRFGDALPVAQKLNFHEIASQTFKKNMQDALQEAMSHAFATAR